MSYKERKLNDVNSHCPTLHRIPRPLYTKPSCFMALLLSFSPLRLFLTSIFATSLWCLQTIRANSVIPVYYLTPSSPSLSISFVLLFSSSRLPWLSIRVRNSDKFQIDRYMKALNIPHVLLSTHEETIFIRKVETRQVGLYSTHLSSHTMTSTGPQL